MNGRPSQCYLFKTCGRKVENATFDCALNKENTLEVHPFIDTEEECEIQCQEVLTQHSKIGENLGELRDENLKKKIN